MKRKHHLLKNEIEMLQMILKEEVFPIKDYRIKLVNQLENLKKDWYKVKASKNDLLSMIDGEKDGN